MSSAFHLSDYTVTLVGKILCYATVALAMDLVWGYAGILSLCHGLFFALGGYAMGMYLMRAIGRDGPGDGGTGPHTLRALPRWERVGVSRPGRETGVGCHGRSWANGIATIEAKSLDDETHFAS